MTQTTFSVLEPHTTVEIMVGCRCTDEDKVRWFVRHVLTENDRPKNKTGNGNFWKWAL